jgi:tetratricopeptide (TPR) repeat protein
MPPAIAACAARAQYALGWAHENSSEFALARAAYERAVRADPGHLRAAEALATLAYDAGDELGARRRWAAIVEQARSLSAPDADNHEVAGWCLFRLGRYAEATARLRRALHADPARTAARFDLALVLLHVPQTQAALDEYEAALEQVRRSGDTAAVACVRLASRELADATARQPGLAGATRAQDALVAAIDGAPRSEGTR